MTFLAPLLAALAVVGPTFVVASGFGWARSGAPPWSRRFWQS